MLVFKCGEWQDHFKTDNIKVIGQTIETCKEMYESGYNLTEEELVFSNNDHVFNGIRVAVKNGKIDHKQVRIHFYPNKDNVSFKEMLMLPSGRLKDWPTGFFDQIDNALIELLG